MAEKLKFYHLTDLHMNSGSSKFNEEMRTVISAAVTQLIDDTQTDIVLISGDLTDSGDRESHNLVVRELERLQGAGKKVYVTFATHDWNMSDCALTRQELRELYSRFGWEQSYDEYETYSYAAKLCEGWRLLALNDDGDGREFCGYKDDELQWIKKQLDDAAACGDRVVAITHHPILPPNVIYPIISHRDMLGGYETTAPFLCENGLRYLFVGHTHMQDIRCIDSKNGNRLYQVNTGSLTQAPAPMRLVTQTDGGLDVKTVFIDEKYCTLSGKSVRNRLESDFENMLRDTFHALGYDVPHFADIAVGLSMDRQVILKYKRLIAPVGKILYKLTFKKAGRLLFCPGSIDKCIADKPVREFFIAVARNIFRGSEDFSPDTPEYKAVTAIVKRAAPLVKMKDGDGNRLDIVKLVSDIIYDDGPDDQNAILS